MTRKCPGARSGADICDVARDVPTLLARGLRAEFEQTARQKTPKGVAYPRRAPPEISPASCLLHIGSRGQQTATDGTNRDWGERHRKLRLPRLLYGRRREHTTVLAFANTVVKGAWRNLTRAAYKTEGEGGC